MIHHKVVNIYRSKINKKSTKSGGIHGISLHSFIYELVYYYLKEKCDNLKMHIIFISKMTHKICSLKINTINKIFNNIYFFPQKSRSTQRTIK